ncbi:hypothetical protein Tsubulata_030718 [Turnera subulata]|uniref:RING-type E3 ubiquitin transferase n=1 Tax=Turnera subulata TaxID=218843 RepID=A0A9Q0G016_9ROSI|nr:hypothetical protein Tsubulata_030718 [Turnera subulata]
MYGIRRKPCKFYAQGGCLKGDDCKFLHHRSNHYSPLPKHICNYYQKGFCSHGSRCRFQHIKTSWIESPPPPASAGASSSSSHALLPTVGVVAPSSSSSSSSSSSYVVHNKIPDAANLNFVPPYHPPFRSESPNPKPEEHQPPPLCLSLIDGDCSDGDNCPYTHGDVCPTCGKHCLHPLMPEQRHHHLSKCEQKQKHLDLLKRSEEIECCVCLDRVLSKPRASDRKFAVLPECDHAFCMSCIMRWRNSSPSSGMALVRTCPTCRTLSHFVVPSSIWYFSPQEKQQIIDGYKAKLRLIDCKHFDSGNGHCPFGTSCFYKVKMSFSATISIILCIPFFFWSYFIKYALLRDSFG